MVKFSELKVGDTIVVSVDGENRRFRLSPADECVPAKGGRHIRHGLHPDFLVLQECLLMFDTPAFGASTILLAYGMSREADEGPGLHNVLSFKNSNRLRQWRAIGAARRLHCGKNVIDQRLYVADGKPTLAEHFIPRFGDSSTNYYLLVPLNDGEIKRL